MSDSGVGRDEGRVEDVCRFEGKSIVDQGWRRE